MEIDRDAEFVRCVVFFQPTDWHPPGTRENLVVTRGAVRIDVAGEQHLLGTGDAIVFEADVPHRYQSVGDEDARMYLVMTYAAPIS